MRIFVTAALFVSTITADGPGGHHHGAHHGAHHAVHAAPHHASVNLGHHQQVGGVIHVGPVAQVNHPVQHAVHHQAPVTHHVTTGQHHSVHGPVHGHFSVAANTVPVVPVVKKPAEVPTIAGLVSTNPKFSTLLAAVKAADLVDVLSSEGPFTVFAPTNTAFDKVGI